MPLKISSKHYLGQHILSYVHEKRTGSGSTYISHVRLLVLLLRFLHPH